MVSDAIKKYRDVFAFGLLAVAVLYLVSGLSLLFKSEDDGFVEFSGRAAANGYLFTHPLMVVSLATAIALAIGFGQASASARAVIIAALVVGGVSMVFGLVAWFAAFQYDGTGFGGVILAGKVVAIFLGLAQLLAMGLTLFFGVVALQSLPKRVPQAQQWGAHAGYPPAAQQWGQPPAQQWGQPGPAPQQWGQQAPPQWGQQASAPHPGWGQPVEQQPWGQHAEVPPAWRQPEQQQAWGQPEPEQQPSWGQQPQQSPGWSTPESQPDATQAQAQQSWSQPEQQSSWEQPAAQEPQSWEQPPAQEAQSWAPAETAEAETATSESGTDAVDDAQVEPGSTDDADAPEGQQDGWWQRPSQ